MERNSNVMKNRLIHSVIRNLATVGYDLHVHGGRLFAVGYSRWQGQSIMIGICTLVGRLKNT